MYKNSYQKKNWFFLIILSYLFIALNNVVIAEEIVAFDPKQVFPYSSLAPIIKPLQPAVVGIYVKQNPKKIERNKKTDNPLEEFFDFFPEPFGGIVLPQPQVGFGSGFIIDRQGFIVTNHHVIEKADEIKVKLFDNTEVVAELIGSDEHTDIALLKINPTKNMSSVDFGDSSNVKTGDFLIVMGNPLGLSGTTTFGIVSHHGRELDNEAESLVDGFIQTDASINRGNSGGPMFNINGEVIGIARMIYSSNSYNIGLGFGIPSNVAKRVIEQLKTKGFVTRGMLNVIIAPITPEIADALNLSSDLQGALINYVSPVGPAGLAGLQRGDIILEFNGQKVTSVKKLQIMVSEAPLNKTLPIAVLRNGKIKNFSVTLTEDENSLRVSKYKRKDKKNSDPDEKYEFDGQMLKNYGVIFVETTKEFKDKYTIPTNITGVIVHKILRESPWAPYLQSGDMIIELDQQKIGNVQDLDKVFKKISQSNRKSVLAFIQKPNKEYTISIALPLDKSEK